MSSLHNNHDYNGSYDDYQEKQYHDHSDDTFIKDNTQTAMKCHHSPAIVSMGDGAGDSVVSGGDCVGGGAATERIECMQF